MNARFVIFAVAAVLPACNKTQAQTGIDPAAAPLPKTSAASPVSKIEKALSVAGIPDETALPILNAARNGAFLIELPALLKGDPFLYRLIDKTHPLPEGYEPSDLVTLKAGYYQISRDGLRLRREAESSLNKMAEAARAEGITLLASSAYRSEAYQREVYGRIAAELGVEAADRESARPGYSQHQSGLTVDFGSITDGFAKTAAGRWLAANASRYGWSLSFPDGYEQVTGYRWESWHYRYVGIPLATFIDNYFGGIQQYALQFIYAYTEGAD